MEHRPDRLNDIGNRLRNAFSKETLTVSCPSSPLSIAGRDNRFWQPAEDFILTRRGRRLVFTKDCTRADIILLHNFGEVSDIFQYLQNNNYKSLFCVWMHDNHIGSFQDTARNCDIFFPCHFVNYGDMANENSLRGPVVPDYTRNIELDVTLSCLDNADYIHTENRVVAQYFIYNSFPRNRHLYALTQDDVFRCYFASQEDRVELYWGLSEQEKNRRWGMYKSSIVVPVHRDISTRIFDGLAWGHTVIVPDTIDGFERVFPQAVQDELSIVRYAANAPLRDVVLTAHKALALFDAGGAEKARARHQFVAKHHTYENRLTDIFSFIENLFHGDEKIFVSRTGGTTKISCEKEIIRDFSKLS